MSHNDTPVPFSVRDGVIFPHELERRVALKRDVVCPAGDPFMEHGAVPACRCRIERRNISAATSPFSFVRHCTGRYDMCPTWQADNPRGLQLTVTRHF